MRFDITCNDTRVCFSQRKDFYGVKRCTLLNGNYKGDNCPFCKEDGCITNGKRYPYHSPQGRIGAIRA